ncbi:uncharacterized protein LOC126234968 [Schistocerca nitens]|uniref:uncharacterized protein LOC126234968 n=1 Tax=Schistocerca nitens TaxID=7011 RepID=UPI002117A8EB|nr:uncharacterized protein LOC126234968 [Schistocerca nitens]
MFATPKSVTEAAPDTDARSSSVGGGGASLTGASVLVLRFAGLWSPRGRAGRRLFALYTALVLACSAAGVATCALSLRSYWGDVQQLSPSLGNAILLLAGIAKAAVFLSRQREFRRLLRMLEQLVSNQAQFARQMGEAYERRRRLAPWLTLLLVGYVTTTFFLWAALPLVLRGSSAQRLLPFSQIRGLDAAPLPLYELAYGVEFASTFYWIYISVGLDCFFASIMTHVTAQFRLLNWRLSSLGSDHQSDGRPEITDGPVTSCEVYQPPKTAATDRVGYTTLSEAVSLSVYRGGWESASRRVRSALLLVMRRAAAPCRLSAAGLCTISRGTFLSLLNASYSCYALFRQVNSR